jgi:hypothetical protein
MPSVTARIRVVGNSSPVSRLCLICKCPPSGAWGPREGAHTTKRAFVASVDNGTNPGGLSGYDALAVISKG